MYNDLPAVSEIWMAVYFGEEPGTTVHTVCADNVPAEDDGMELTVDALFMDSFLLEYPMCSYPGPDCPDES